MEIEDYRALALDNGLVVMQIDLPLAPYKVGGFAGFTPEDAMFYHMEGIAHPKDGPVKFPEPKAPAPPPPPALVDIPADWRHLNRLQKAQIVAALHGTTLTPSITTKECDDAIQAEINRRQDREEEQDFPRVTAAGLRKG